MTFKAIRRFSRGSYAEYAVVPASKLAPVPPGLILSFSMPKCPMFMG